MFLPQPRCQSHRQSLSLPLPLPEAEPTVQVGYLLTPQQAAWVRAHGGRSGASSFMRRLLAQLIEEEGREIERVRARLSAEPSGERERLAV